MKHDDAFINPLEEQLEDAFPQVLKIENNEDDPHIGLDLMRTLVGKFFDDFNRLCVSYNGGNLAGVHKLITNIFHYPMDYQVFYSHMTQKSTPRPDAMNLYIAVVEFINDKLLSSGLPGRQEQTMEIPDIRHFFLE